MQTVSSQIGAEAALVLKGLLGPFRSDVAERHKWQVGGRVRKPPEGRTGPKSEAALLWPYTSSPK